MKAIPNIILMIMLLAVPIAAHAETSDNDAGIMLPQHFTMFGSADNNNVLSAECIGEPPYAKISCHFTEIIVSKMTDAEKKKNRDELADIDKMTNKELNDFAKAIGGPDAIKKMKGRIAIAATPEKKASMQDYIALAREAGQAKDKKAIKQVTQKFNKMKEDTCTIRLHVFAVTFNRQTKTKWISNPGPAGLCNVIRVTTLENLVDYPSLWKFTQVVASSDKDKPCNDVSINKPIIYSWDMAKDMMMGCKYLAFE